MQLQALSIVSLEAYFRHVESEKYFSELNTLT